MNPVPFLRELGLTEYEARAVSSLFSRPATAREIVEFTAIPPTKVYQVLKGLELRGIVKSGGGKPRVYRRVSPASAVAVLLERRLGKLKELAEKASIFAENFAGYAPARKCRMGKGYILSPGVRGYEIALAPKKPKGGDKNGDKQ